MTVLKIIPQIKLPRNIEGIFDYILDNQTKKINQGQLCIIPFRRQDTLGLCVAVEEQKNLLKSKKILPIKKILETIPPLPAYYLKTINWLRNEYFTSLSSLVYNALPALPLPFANTSDQLIKFYNKLNISQNYSLLKIPRKEIAYIKNFLIAVKNSSKKFFFIEAEQLIKNYYLDYILYIKIIEQHCRQGQILILCPTIARLKEFLNYLPPAWRRQIVILNSEIYKNKNLYWLNFLKIINNQASIIIGARSAILAPYANLKMIIIDQAESQDYRQTDQNPRYDARRIAYKLSEIGGIKLIFSSIAYRVEDYFVKSNHYQSKI